MLNPVVRKFKLLILGSKIGRMEVQSPSFHQRRKLCEV